MDFQEEEKVRSFLISLFEPREGLVFLIQTGIHDGEIVGGDVALPGPAVGPACTEGSTHRELRGIELHRDYRLVLAGPYNPLDAINRAYGVFTTDEHLSLIPYAVDKDLYLGLSGKRGVKAF